MDRELYGPDRPQVYTRERSRDNPGVRFRARTSERSRYGSDDDSDSDSSRPRAPPSPRRRYRSPSRVRSAVSSSRRYHVSRPRSRSVYSDESEEIILRPGGAPPPRDEYDEGASSVIYDFVPSWTGGLSAQTTAFSGTDDDDGVVDGHPAFEGGKSKYPVTNVHESQYTGDGLFGGTHTAGLSTSDSGQPIFRWM